MHADSDAIVAATRQWISSIVIGLNLCPFAQRVFLAERIRYVVSPATDAETLRTELGNELDTLAACPIERIETTLLIHPGVLTSFSDYVDFLEDAERVVRGRGLRGVIQIASFHPQYQFEESEPDDVENYTNRSPYPMLHLLREDSVSAVAVDEEELLEIPRRNIETLRRLGKEKLLERLRAGRS